MKDFKRMQEMIGPKRTYAQKRLDIEFGVKGIMPYFDQKRIFISDDDRKVMHQTRKDIMSNERKMKK